MTRVDGRPIAAAGLWTSWRDESHGPDAPWLHSCCLVTTDANATMAPVHDRMPVVLEESDWAEWLDADGADRARLAALMVPADPSVLRVVDVSTLVNSVRNDSAELIEPVVR